MPHGYDPDGPGTTPLASNGLLKLFLTIDDARRAVSPSSTCSSPVARLRSSAGARELGVDDVVGEPGGQAAGGGHARRCLTRTTRNVVPTEAGQRLIERAGPALREALAALSEGSAKPGETIGGEALGRAHRGDYVIEPIPAGVPRAPSRIEVEVVSTIGSSTSWRRATTRAFA